MIHPELHTNPVPLDRQQHRLLRVRRDMSDITRFAALNSSFVVAGEFAEVCKDYPLVWIHAGQDSKGEPQVAPIAVFGLTRQDNLCIQRGAWRTSYLPVVLRVYPFAMARSSADMWAVCYDATSPRFSLSDGESLFGADGEPSDFTRDVQKQLEQVEAEVERTRQIGRELLRCDLLRDMRFEAKLPGGGALNVEGFLTVDDQRFGALSDADVVTLHKNGVLALIHAHHVSLSNMRRLAQWHVDRHGATPSTDAAPPAAASPAP
jgi:hypothetical protein